MDKLKLLGKLASLGYVPFISEGDKYLKSEQYYLKVSLQDKASDPYFITISSDSGKSIKVWNFLYDQIIEPADWLEEIIVFKNGLFINADRFVIPVPALDATSLTSYVPQNAFKRPAINKLDDRYDLGDKIFIVTDAGILFSAYEKPFHKVTNGFNLNIFENKNTVFTLKHETLGEYKFPLVLSAIHVFPVGDFWNQRIYTDWE